jgi:hypothetical protein
MLGARPHEDQMIELKRSVLPPATAAVIDRLAGEPALESFCLVGGTAMALQVGHRRSLDIDLVTFGKTLDKNGLSKAMRTQGAILVTPPSMISSARINGIDLLTHVQDYVLDGVKVQCFANPSGQRFASGVQAVTGWRFGLMDLSTLFAMKSALLLKRSRSRDYFDLMWFCLHQGKSLADIVLAAQAADDSPEVPTVVEHKLLGLLPLDPADEGLDPVDVAVTVADIYQYFEGILQASEVTEARRLIESLKT